MQPLARPAAVLLILATFVAGCGASSSSSSSAAAKPALSGTTSKSSGTAQSTVASGHVSVSIRNYAYQPTTITVKPGTKVTFTNHDQTAHTATSSKTAFDTGTVKPGASATVTVAKPGSYPYYCQFHAFMHGTIAVK